jgi:glycosyltransferase involved in cell wall biosynthesis
LPSVIASPRICGRARRNWLDADRDHPQRGERGVDPTSPGCRRATRISAERLYAVYVGKLAPNKGTSHLIDVIARAELDWPLIVVGDGPDRRASKRRQGLRANRGVHGLAGSRRSHPPAGRRESC